MQSNNIYSKTPIAYIKIKMTIAYQQMSLYYYLKHQARKEPSLMTTNPRNEENIPADKNEQIAHYFKSIIQALGEDPGRDGLIHTPHRAARALKRLTAGYHMQLDEVVNGAIFVSDMDQMVLVKDIELYSICEHHLLPFFGKCHVAYIPNGHVIGLSKIARIVDMFAKRLQIQEQLTTQIAKTIQDITGAKGVGVVIDSQHLCMMMRGVSKQNAKMKTSCMEGVFRESNATRSEFFRLLSD